MRNINIKPVFYFFMLVLLSFSSRLVAQNTKIRGFADMGIKYQDETVDFVFGEYDLFITSELNDRISFLGETVFSYDSDDEHFEVSVERVILNYNYKGNHSILLGKHHTPVNFWNNNYHHGRVFFPTIERPLLFEAHIIPLHTTGIAFQGLNLGKLKFGYNLMIGNGLGSEELKDNDKYKSITAAVQIKPLDKLQIGLSFYSDVLSEGAELHHEELIEEEIKQKLYTGSVSYFGRKYEVLAEGTFVNNKTENTGNNSSFASYIYAGLRLNEKWIPYFRFDHLKFQDEEPYLGNDDATAFIVGLRYEVNYLIAVKLEFQNENRDLTGIDNTISTQIAIGF